MENMTEIKCFDLDTLLEEDAQGNITIENIDRRNLTEKEMIALARAERAKFGFRK